MAPMAYHSCFSPTSNIISAGTVCQMRSAFTKRAAAAHTAISKAQGVPDDVVDSLRDGTALTDPKLEALRVFAVTINESRGWPEQSDIDALLSAGYTERTVLEVILGTAVKVMSNYTNHIASTPLDGAFSDVEWTPAELSSTSG